MSAADWSEDLYTLLSKASLKPPFVIVAHSAGGFTARLFATRYPQEVAGMVLVDSSHPDQYPRWRAVLPAKTSNENPDLAKLRAGLEDSDNKNIPVEGGVDMVASAEQVRATGKLGSIPLVVLSSSPDNHSGYPAGLPEDLYVQLAQVWSALQKDLLGLSTNSSQVVAQRSGHYIQYFEPELVITAIQSVLKQVQAK